MSGRSAVVAMSGGVDSSAAALLLLREGYRVRGVTFAMGAVPSADADAAASARRVCDALGIEHRTVDISERFEENVLKPFERAYEEGRTPNPCVRCNRFVKFATLAEFAEPDEYLATGHYARIRRFGAGFALSVARCAAKDQTYMLSRVGAEHLSRALFPLGEVESKAEVREIARSAGLGAAERKDSQDICFVPDGDFAAWLERRGVAMTDGPVVGTVGRVLGRHRGQARYTPGQRKGLGISLQTPVYVIRRDAAANTVVVGAEDELYSTAVRVSGVNMLAERIPDAPLFAKTRYTQKLTPVTGVEFTDGGAVVRFGEPVRAAAPGQTLAIYSNGDVVLGAEIEEAER